MIRLAVSVEGQWDPRRVIPYVQQVELGSGGLSGIGGVP